MEKLLKFSNPTEVMAKGKKMGIDVYISNRKDKKYKIIDPKTGKIVHFGAMGYEDYTLHKDDKRRQLFLKRNANWAKAKPYTPAWASYFLLWN